jgi:antitoxin (DNA-binding transcriptional repressor) of toxin-antitoxin stability system
MRKTSVRELHIHTSALVKEAAEGGVIVIERRGQPVAELRPLSSASMMNAAVKADIFRSMKEVWDRSPVSGDSTTFIEDDRNR